VSPVEKVLELLQGMLSKAEKALQEEKVQWSHYQQWCSDTKTTKEEIIRKTDLHISALSAEIESLKADVERLEGEVEENKIGISDREAEKKKAGETRVEERQEYTTLHQDYSESVHALTEAIAVLKEQNYDRPGVDLREQAVALLQKFGGGSAAKLLEASAGEPGVANAYEFRAGNIVEMLSKLLDDFQRKLTDLEKEGMTNQHNYEMLAQDLSSQIGNLKHEISKKEQLIGEKRRLRSEAVVQFDSASATRAEDAKFLEEMVSTCEQKSTDFEARQQLRTDEISVLTKAIEILSGPEVAGAAEKHLAGLQVKAAPALVQLLRGANTTKTNNKAAVDFLRKSGKALKSEALTSLAASVTSAEDPFAKVKTLIQQLIDRLKAEETEEAQHKAWCDEELSTNEATRTSKTEEVEGLYAKIDKAEATSAQLKREIAELSTAVAEMRKELARLGALRGAEQNHNEEAIADAVAAQMALSDALKLLENFYGTAKSATALLQKGKEAPPIFSKSFNGQQPESDNIIAFLQVIHSDFARLERETSAAEAAAKQDYDSMVETSNADISEKEALIEKKTREEAAEAQDLFTAKTNLELTQSELDTALEYYDKLKPSCLIPADAASQDASYSERVRRREEEIQSLKEALQILNGELVSDVSEGLYSSVDGGNYGMDVQK